MELRVDGATVSVPDGATVLAACDAAGRYVPRLCSYPGLGSPCELGVSCGLCVVRLDDAENRGPDRGSGPHPGSATVLACSSPARPGLEVTTQSPELRAARLARLAAVLSRHPHICLSCPDRDGCTREECTFGIPKEARCCSEFGRCELGKVVAHADPGVELPRRGVAAPRDSWEEGRIRWEPGLCVGCGRCVVVCSSSGAAGDALRLAWVEAAAPEGASAGGEAAGDAADSPGGAAPRSGGRWQAVPKAVSLRASGCTFCGQCVMVCPAGAVTAPGEAGARWLEGWRKRTGLALPVLPPGAWRLLTDAELATLPRGPGVFVLADNAGRIVRISGVADLSRGVAFAAAEPACREACRFLVEPAALFTQRESELLARFAQAHGHLPPGNDLGDDLFSDDLLDDDYE